jgi:hypothetical protein
MAAWVSLVEDGWHDAHSAADANQEAARFGAEFKVKITAPQQPVPPPKIQGFPYVPVKFDGLTITRYTNNRWRIARSFRAKGMRAPSSAKTSRAE